MRSLWVYGSEERQLDLLWYSATRKIRHWIWVSVWGRDGGLHAMTALMQELSVRLSIFTRSLPLSTLRRESSTHLYRQLRSLHIRLHSSASASSSSSSSLPVVDSFFPIPLLGCASSFRHLSAAAASGTDDLKLLGALGRNDRVGSSSTTGDLAITAGLKFSDDDNIVDSATEDFVSDGDSEETEDEKVPNESAQFDDSEGYVKYVQKDEPTKAVQAPNYLTMTDKQLFAKCRMDTYRASGPGGQHRNKTDSAVRLTHTPTGLVSQAADDRSQHINRSLALTRLRQIIALEVRDPVELDGYKPPLELVRILPSGTGGKRGNSQRIGPNHPEFILGMKALMDLLYATGGSVSDAGKVLGLTTGALSKLITSNNLLWQGVNKLRSLKGLKPLR